MSISRIHVIPDVNRIKETITIGGKDISLSSGEKRKKGEENGYFYQTGFELASVPKFTYFADGVLIEKSVAYEWEKNTVAVLYKIKNRGEDSVFSLVPSYNFRDHNAGSTKKDLKFKEEIAGRKEFFLVPDKRKDIRLSTYVSDGHILINSD